MKKLSLAIFLIFTVILIVKLTYRSRKGQFIRIYSEAVQIQNLLKKIESPTKKDLQDTLFKIEKKDDENWAICNSPGFLIRSKNIYRNYNNYKNSSMFYYSIDRGLNIVLIPSTSVVGIPTIDL